ncbi:helix-turn-helix domain-containing protein [Chitinophaga japonensis]|uniref:Zn-dependent peptidase ImmA (M78 family) n=1 Tax=Chitinophaga japonensis TaxID=104662 RepID=A0A562TCP5_CHIJA|nr:XRE family transcriptional regulator [Chitinophaga japonensis]TWI91024.1 Zn-dependent peptidase ImmA (M78 family) [Chitinophaga japonensis]
MLHFATRLKNARKMKGFSLQDLADAMNCAISRQALSKYENGQMKPDSNTLIALSKALGVGLEYFARPSTITLDQVDFRKKVSLPVKELDRIRQEVIDFLERYFELESLSGIKSAFKNPISKKITAPEDVENAAAQLRKHWHLGNAPIYNVVELLEEKEIKVLQIETNPSFSGMATWIQDRYPVIVLNNHTQVSVVRKRFTALHELGHLLMDLQDLENKEKERACDAFAGAMLLPADTLQKELGGHRQHIFLPELILIKEQYGISLPAIIYRAKNLGLVTDALVKQFMIKYNKDNLRYHEPGAFNSPEQSTRFRQLLLRAVAEEIITTSKAAALNKQKLAEFRESELI